MPVEIEVTTRVWKAFDGSTHLTFEDAKAHEDENFGALLVGLTAEQIAAALERKPDALHIADALEKAGSLIGRARRESGELRRARNGEGKASGGTEPQTDTAPAADGQTAEAA